MSKRGENIRKRKDGRWEARFHKGRSPSGKLIYGYVYAGTYRDVKAKQLESIKQFAEHNSQNNDILFSSAAEQWLSMKSQFIKPSTLLNYTNLLETHILPDFGNKFISEIDQEYVSSKIIDKLTYGRIEQEGGLSINYIKKMLVIINAILSFNGAKPISIRESTKGIIPQRQDSVKVLEKHEQNKLEEYITSNLSLYGIGILLSLRAGLRIGETCALKWEDVDMESGIIYVKHTVARVTASENEGCKTKLIIDSPKTDSSLRKVPISSDLIPILSQYHSTSKSPFVISESDSFLSPRTFEYRYHQILRKAGINDTNYHALRHTFATRCIDAELWHKLESRRKNLGMHRIS